MDWEEECGLDRCLVIRGDREYDVLDVKKRIDQTVRNLIVDHLLVVAVDFADARFSEMLDTLFVRYQNRWRNVSFEYCRGPIHLYVSMLLSRFPTTKVESLNLHGVLVDADIARAVNNGLVASEVMKKLVFCGSTLPASSTSVILDGFKTSKTAESLRFNNSDFDWEATNKLALGLQSCHRIKRLDLFSCNLDDEQASTVVKSLEESECLEHLDLGCNCCGFETLKALSNLLLKSRSLHTLNLALQRCRCETDHLDLFCMTPGLTQNTSLKTLYLRGNWLSPDCFKDLLQCLLHDNHLEKLMLTDCLLSQFCIQSILEKLIHIKRLRHLWLDGCQSICLSSRKQLAKIATQAIRSNCILESLKFPFGFDEYRRELDSLLDLNRGGRRLILHDPVCYVSLWPRILERVNSMTFPCTGKDYETRILKRRANIIYYLLRQKVLVG